MTVERPGALVISLDFELHWGSRDHVAPGSPAFAELAPSRTVGSELATRFAQRGIRATWATVGFLFASTRDELDAAVPTRRPAYVRTEFDAFQETVGVDETADPEHLAGSLVAELASLPGQEVASHTFSHFYCLERGQSEEDFRADLAAAQALARRHGLTLTSLVLPRNQWNPAYAGAVIDNGFTAFRGPQPSRGHEARANSEHSRIDRATRLVDTYAGLTPPPTFAWDSLLRPDGLCDIPASAFLRPYSPGRRRLEPLRYRRLVSGLQDAARRGRVFHLWWHPHNFAGYPAENFAFLDRLLDEYDRLAVTEGMRSVTMRDVAGAVAAGSAP
jgi:hypothetical protein